MPQYFVLNKPPGCITGTRDPEGRPTVYEHVPPHYPRLPHVGRLDYNTEGLLLFTDDGALSRALLDRKAAGRPEGIPKVYSVKLRGRLPEDAPRLQELALPLCDPRGPTTPAEVRWLALRKRATWVQLTIYEGRHRQIRRLCERSGFQIVKLRRTRLGPLELGELRLRWCRPLSLQEVQACYAAALPGREVPRVEPIVDTAEAYRAARGRRSGSVVDELRETIRP